MFAMQGIYDDGIVTIDEPVPVKNKYNVVVTFVKPFEQIEEGINREVKLDALSRITGILSGSTVTLEEAREERFKRQ